MFKVLVSIGIYLMLVLVLGYVFALLAPRGQVERDAEEEQL